MPRQVKIGINESVTTLKELLQKTDNNGKRARIETLIMLKTRSFRTIKELSSELQYNYPTVCRWLRIYRKGGLDELIKQRKKQETDNNAKNKTTPATQSKRVCQVTPQILVNTDGEVIFYPSFLTEKDSNQLFAELINIAWRDDCIKKFGKSIPLPRRTAWYADSGKSYTYSGIAMEPNEWTKPLLSVKKKVEKISGFQFNGVLLNLYRDGRDSVAWHSDDEPEFGKIPIIASVSLGETRRFMLKHKYRQDLDIIEVDLTPGSLLLMKGKTQHFWQHQIPKTKKIIKERINLTFRILK